MASCTYRLPRRYRYRGHRKASGRTRPPSPSWSPCSPPGWPGESRGVPASPRGHRRGRPPRHRQRHRPGHPSGWARGLLAADGLPQTSCNMSAVLEWEAREGGGFGNQAHYNPLNVNPGPGAGWPGYPAIGAWPIPRRRDRAAVHGPHAEQRLLRRDPGRAAPGELRAGSVQRDHGQPVGGQPLRRHPTATAEEEQCSGNADSGQPCGPRAATGVTGAGAAGRS